IAPPIAAGVVAACLWLVILSQGLTSPERVFLRWWVVFAVATSATQWTLGLGWHLLAIRKNWSRAIGYVLAGAVLGAAVSVAVPLASLLMYPGGTYTIDFSREFFAALIVFATFGVALMSGSMWLIWLMRRPDRDIAPEDPSVFD